MKLVIRIWLLVIISSLVIVSWSLAQTTFDPLTVGVGARALGMGKAYVAVAEDGDTIFFNPAGLGEIDTFQFSSMSGTIMEDVNYTMLGGVYPLGAKSALGIGYTAATVSGIELRDAAGTYSEKTTFGSSVLFASYGRKLSEKFSLGINLKFFSQDATTANRADGSGINLDVGILQKGVEWLSIGVVGQNLLGSSKIRYNDSYEENLPLGLKVGTKLHLLGSKFQAALLSPIELVAVADADLNLRASDPTTTHLGLELSPSSLLTLRAGIDQDPKPGGVQNNATYGVSLKYAGVGFHYAYHAYTNFPENNSHFFSLSFNERGWPLEDLPTIAKSPAL
ncbi:PorV/PorQ family protein [Candidatus Margulisiibacteriota bacterium]